MSPAPRTAISDPATSHTPVVASIVASIGMLALPHVSVAGDDAPCHAHATARFALAVAAA